VIRISYSYPVERAREDSVSLTTWSKREASWRASDREGAIKSLARNRMTLRQSGRQEGLEREAEKPRIDAG